MINVSIAGRPASAAAAGTWAGTAVRVQLCHPGTAVLDLAYCTVYILPYSCTVPLSKTKSPKQKLAGPQKKATSGNKAYQALFAYVEFFC